MDENLAFAASLRLERSCGIDQLACLIADFRYRGGRRIIQRETMISYTLNFLGRGKVDAEAMSDHWSWL